MGFRYAFFTESVDVDFYGGRHEGVVIYSRDGVALLIGIPPFLTVVLERILARVDEDGVYYMYGSGNGEVYRMQRRPDRSIPDGMVAK